jgi:hypothetical protein
MTQTEIECLGSLWRACIAYRDEELVAEVKSNPTAKFPGEEFRRLYQVQDYLFATIMHQSKLKA